MAGWIGYMAAWLEHIGAAIGRHVRAGATIHADDTPVPALDPGRGKTKTGRLWVAVRDERPFGSTAPPAAFFLYSPDRKAAHAKEPLDACRGALHADGYAGFSDLYVPDPKTGAPKLVEAACWAHARRHIYMTSEVNAVSANVQKSKVRSAVEHVFAHQKGLMGLLVRTIGLGSGAA